MMSRDIAREFLVSRKIKIPISYSSNRIAERAKENIELINLNDLRLFLRNKKPVNTINYHI